MFVFNDERLKYLLSKLKTQLENIPGIGPKKAKFLLEKYGSVEKIKNISKEELASLPQIGERLAENLCQFFRQYNQE